MSKHETELGLLSALADFAEKQQGFNVRVMIYLGVNAAVVIWLVWRTS